MNLFFVDTFDNDTAGALPAYLTAIAGTWDVHNNPANAVSSPNVLRNTTHADADRLLLLGGSGVSVPATTDMTLFYDTKTLGGPAPAPIVRSDSAGQNYYVWAITAGTTTAAQLYKAVSGSLSPVGSQTSAAVDTTGNPIVHVKASAVGSAISLKMWTGANAEPGSPQWSQTDASVAAAGYAGFYQIGTSSGGDLDNLTLYGNSSLAAGALSSSSVMAGSLTVSSTSASGGSPPYTYQWYRSTASGAVPQTANAVSGATSLTLNDSGLTENTAYYYRLIATDSVGAIVWSSELSVTTATSSELASGSASLNSVGTTVAAVTVADATGGTPAYSYQWYRSTTSGFAPSGASIVAGATSRTLNDTGLSPLTTYYYKNIVTDSVSATATSNQIAATTGAALAAGIASSTFVGVSRVHLSTTNATGGSGTYTYQWYRSTTAGVNGSAVAGATSESLIDTAASPNTDYYYSLQYADTAGESSVFSAQAHIKTLSATAMEVIGGIGDSIMAGTFSSVETPFAAMIDHLNYRQSVKQFRGINQAISGTTSEDWASTSPGSDLINAVTAFNSAGVTRVVLMLGTNDSKQSVHTSPSTYAANISAIVAYLKGNVASLRTIHLFSSPFLSPASGDLSIQNCGRILAYGNQLASIADGSTVFFSQPFASYNLFQIDASLLRDGIHPTDEGDQTLGALWASNVASDVSSETPAGYPRSRVVNV